ncbi:MAG: cellulase family glycosylhydrolase, partial [Mycobacteriaceae bacterium]
MARWLSHARGVRVHALIAALLCLGTLAASSAPAAAAPTTVSLVQATSGTLSGWGMQSVADPSATAGSAVKFGWSGTLQVQVSLPADADGVTLRVRGDQCAGAPAYTLSIDGAQVASNNASSTSWTTAASSVPLVAGTHVVQVAFTNPGGQYLPTACSRVLYLDTVAFTSSGPLPTSPPIPAGYVHRSGTGLLDGADHPIRLRGVNLGGWLEWQGWEWGEGFDYIGESAMMGNLSSLVGATQADQFRTDVYNNFITPSDFHAMGVDGLNTARVPFNYRMLEDDAHPFVYKQSGWDVLDRLVSEAKQANIYLILDMSVAPCSQMYAFISDYVSGPYLWSSTQCQDRMVAMWKAIAARYANSNVIAGYDVLNETIIGDAQLRSLYQR